VFRLDEDGKGEPAPMTHEQSEELLKAALRNKDEGLWLHLLDSGACVARRFALGAKEHVALQQAEARWGVPAEVIVGVVGVETFYGRMTGNFRILDALAAHARDAGFPDPDILARQLLLLADGTIAAILTAQNVPGVPVP
jgi:hypothetical protein